MTRHEGGEKTSSLELAVCGWEYPPRPKMTVAGRSFCLQVRRYDLREERGSTTARIAGAAATPISQSSLLQSCLGEKDVWIF